jgi:hypothetical protein
VSTGDDGRSYAAVVEYGRREPRTVGEIIARWFKKDRERTQFPPRPNQPPAPPPKKMANAVTVTVSAPVGPSSLIGLISSWVTSTGVLAGGDLDALNYAPYVHAMVEEGAPDAAEPQPLDMRFAPGARAINLRSDGTDPARRKDE